MDQFAVPHIPIYKLRTILRNDEHSVFASLIQPSNVSHTTAKAHGLVADTKTGAKPELALSLTQNDVPEALSIVIAAVYRIEQHLLSQSSAEKPATDDPNYSITEAAIKLNLKSRTSVYKLIHSGAIPSITISKRQYIKGSAIQTYLNPSSGKINNMLHYGNNKYGKIKINGP